MKTKIPAIVLLLAFLSAVPLCAAAPPGDAKAELKARFEQRHDAVNKLKKEGTVGETWQGYLEIVKEGAKLEGDAKKLFDEENGDRTKLYGIIASNVGAKGERKLSVDQVAERNGRRNFQKARPGDYLKSKEGRWIRREEVNALKKQGKAGETGEGYVEPVKDASLDEQGRVTLLEENRIRRDIYQDEADDRKKSVDAVAQQAGKKNIDAASKGEWVKDKGGEWKKKG